MLSDQWPTAHPAVYCVVIEEGLSQAQLDVCFARMPDKRAVRVRIIYSGRALSLQIGPAVKDMLCRDYRRPRFTVYAPNTAAGSIARRSIHAHMIDTEGHGGTSMEIGLRNGDFIERSRGRPNPVDEAVVQAARDFPQAQYMLLVRDALVREVCKRANVVGQPHAPAFITGCTPPPGGPMHNDEYHSVAMVVAGAKAFYILPPDVLLPGRARNAGVNGIERKDLSPVDGCKGAGLAWSMAYLEAGDMLYLPPLHWHWVISEAGSVMTNVWYDPDPDMASPTPQSWFERAMAYSRGLLGGFFSEVC
jgi:hypothetical protein